MSLTVPQAGVIAGRAPNMAAVPVVASDAGSAIAGLGDRLLQVGTAIEEERSQRELAKARVQMMDGLNGLRLEFEQSGSPDDIDKNFAPRAQELRQQILGGLSARSQGPGAEMFDELQAAHGFALGKRAIDLRQSERMATLSQTQQTVMTTAAGADPTTRAVVLGQFDDQLQGLVANGTITPEAAQTIKMKTLAEIDDASAITLLSKDPAALIAQIDDQKNPGFSNLDPSRRAQLRGWAAADLAGAAKTRAAEMERADKERLAGAKDLLKDGIDVYRASGKGRDFARAQQAEEALKDPAVAALPEAQEYAHAKLLFEAQPGFAALPLAEKQKLLAEAEARPIAKGYEANLADAMRAQIAADEDGFAKDPIGYAGKIGLKPAPALPDPVSTGAADLVSALRDRRHYAASLQQSGYVSTARYFEPSEAEAFKAAAGADRSPEERAKLSSAFAVAFGDDADRAASEIGADPLFGYVGGLIASGGDERLARQIFDGARVLSNKDVMLPGPTQRRGAFFSEFSGLFSDGTTPGTADEAGQRDQIIAAADALYAWRERANPAAATDIIDTVKYAQAVHEVMGGTGAFNSRSARGGVQDVRGRLTMLPPGVAGGDVEDALDTLKNALPETWRAISASGNRPVAGGAPIGPREAGQTSLRWIDGTRYELVVNDPSTGALASIWGDDGKPYILDLSKLRGAQ